MKMDEIKEILELFDTTQTTKLHLQQGDFYLKLEKGGVAPKIIDAPISHTLIEQPETRLPINPTPTTEKPAFKGEIINSPMVGTFYRSPSPGAPAYVNVGDKVKKGQTLAIIEAMKIMNEIEAEFDCQIIEIVPSDAQPVEYGSPLFMVKKL